MAKSWFEKLTGRPRSAVSWASGQSFPKPLPLGAIEAEVIERTVPGMLVRSPAPLPTQDDLSRDERNVFTARTRVLGLLREVHGLSLSVEDHRRLLEAPLGSWGRFAQRDGDGAADSATA